MDLPLASTIYFLLLVLTFRRFHDGQCNGVRVTSAVMSEISSSSTASNQPNGFSYETVATANGSARPDVSSRPDTTQHMDADSNIFWNDIWNAAFVSCAMDQIVLITEDIKVENYFLTIFRHRNIPLQLFHAVDSRSDSQSVAAWIADVYTNHHTRHFIIAVQNPEVILNVADQLFQTDHRGQAAVLPHRTLWLVIAWSGHQVASVRDQQARSALDNVAVIQMGQPSSWSSPSRETKTVSTFMWRQNRTKQAEIVDWNSLKQNRTCALFPNIYFGLNGRELKVLAKTYLETFLRIETSPQGTHPEYAGLLKDILDSSSEQLNFTYSYEPGMEESEGMPWASYVERLENGSADIGLSPWSLVYQARYYNNMSFSYPMLFDQMKGIYRNPAESELYQSLFLLCPFPPVVYLYFFALLIYITTVYVVYVRFIYRSKNTHQMRNDLIFDRRLTYKWDEENKDEKYLSSDFFSRLLFTVFVFFASILNQSYLPRPRQMSSQTLVGVWSAGMVLFYAIYQSYLTAEMIQVSAQHPVHTFQDLVSRDDYNCGVVNQTVASHFLLSAPNGSLAAKLRRRVKLMDLSEFQAIDGSIQTILNSMGYNFVLIYQESVLRAWLSQQEYPERYVILSDALFRSDMSIVFPPRSELNAVVSRELVRLYESGLHGHIYSRHSGFRQNNSRDDEETRKGHPIPLDRLAWLSFVCLMCLALATCVLGMELIISRRRRMIPACKDDGGTGTKTF